MGAFCLFSAALSERPGADKWQSPSASTELFRGVLSTLFTGRPTVANCDFRLPIVQIDWSIMSSCLLDSSHFHC